MTAQELIDFEHDVANLFEAGHIRAPVHLSGGNETQLIEIFRDVRPEDYVFSTWRSHYHALLKGVPREALFRQIIAGRSMFIASPEHNFYASAIVGGCLPIACGVAEEGARVWCFIGDMCASTGHYADARRFALSRGLDLRFVVEDNGLSTNTPTEKAWSGAGDPHPVSTVRRYTYQRTWPHYAAMKKEPF